MLSDDYGLVKIDCTGPTGVAVLPIGTEKMVEALLSPGNGTPLSSSFTPPHPPPPTPTSVGKKQFLVKKNL